MLHSSLNSPWMGRWWLKLSSNEFRVCQNLVLRFTCAIQSQLHFFGCKLSEISVYHLKKFLQIKKPALFYYKYLFSFFSKIFCCKYAVIVKLEGWNNSKQGAYNRNQRLLCIAKGKLSEVSNYDIIRISNFRVCMWVGF